MKKVIVFLLCLALMLPAAIAGAAPAKPSPASDLRATLDSLLGEHALLAIVAMQKGYDNAPDFANVAAALGKNTDDLTAAITSVFGADAGKAFNTMWSAHIGFFVDYVKATAAKDEAGRKAALDKLAGYKKDFSDFLSGATKIPAADLASGLQMHVDQLVAAFDSYVNKDYKTTYKNMREAYAHMYMTGDALSSAIVANMPDKFSGNPKADDVNLRITLDRLLSEHAFFAVLAMQKGGSGAADFNAVAAALNDNTNDLTAAIGSVFGPDAGKAFNGLWSAHIGFFVDLVKATVGKDDAGRKAALDKLANYKNDFSKFLSGATKIPQGDLASGLQMHVDQLVSAFDSYVNKNYDTVYTSLREAYKHMMMTGDALASAITANMAGDAPSVMPKTGMGGMSGMDDMSQMSDMQSMNHAKQSNNGLLSLIVIVLAVAAGAAGITVYNRRKQMN